MTELNEPQKQAVLHESGPLLVFAGAGSGKTRTITYRIANLLAAGVAPYRILAVTFTNKAAGEMKQRIEKLAGAEVTRDLWVGTFHSVCARFLRRHHESVGLGRNFVIYDDSDQRAMVVRILRELGLDERELSPKSLLSAISREKREGRNAGEAKFEGHQNDVVLEIYARYERALGLANAVDFDDLILRVARLAEDAESAAGHELRGRFLHVLVDEFQDTNLIQYRLIRSLSARHRNLCVVGDDDQSIYGWRGADVRLIRSFRRDFPDATVVKLEQNYRSTSNIVRAALGVIEPAHEREPKRLWTEAPPGEPVRVRAVKDEREEAGFVVRTLRNEIARSVSAGEIAIFYRVHAQSRTLEEALRSANVPYQVIGGMKFFERAEVKNLLAYLRLVANPQSDSDLLRVINVPARGIGDKTVERLTDIASERALSVYHAIPHAISSGELGSAAQKKLTAFRTLLDELGEYAKNHAPSELAARALETTGYRDMLFEADSAEADARLGNLEELVGSIREYELELEQAGEEPSLEGYLERVALITAVDTLADAPKVSLMTVHSAKGLEFDVVFLTGMEQEIFPYRGINRDEPEELDEERRLAYVAITRAKKRLYISYAGIRTLFGQTRYLARSQFLDDLPESAVVLEGSAAPRVSPYGRNPERALYAPSGYAPRAAAPAPRAGTRVVERDDHGPGGEEGPRPGSRVWHRQFGEGIVEHVEFGMKPTVVAIFGDYGRRRILAQYLEYENP
jgi:DNA helicase-2/ATP-dependent DNA helicase PcrA